VKEIAEFFRWRFYGTIATLAVITIHWMILAGLGKAIKTNVEPFFDSQLLSKCQS
jgi:hypothetical protein